MLLFIDIIIIAIIIIVVVVTIITLISVMRISFDSKKIALTDTLKKKAKALNWTELNWTDLNKN